MDVSICLQLEWLQRMINEQQQCEMNERAPFYFTGDCTTVFATCSHAVLFFTAVGGQEGNVECHEGRKQ